MANTATKKKSTKGKTKSGGMSAKKRNSLDDKQFAFPEDRKMPLNDASHVRNAVARFDQVKGQSTKAKDRAWKRIKKAAKKLNVELSEKSWRELGGKKSKKKG